jgi:hypothetical protein
MATLRDFFHIGRVEWVTCQVPLSQGMEGGWKVGDVELGAPETVGARRVMGGEADAGGAAYVDILALLCEYRSLLSLQVRKNECYMTIFVVLRK